MFNSHIVITDDLESYQEKLKSSFPPSKLKLFFREDFLIEDAKTIVKEAYIAENDIKIIAFGAKSFNNVAQNSLLKILEEPPRNIVFIIVATSKTALLATIKSRLTIKFEQSLKQRQSLSLNFHSFGLEEANEFIIQNKNLDKNSLKSLLQEVVLEAIKQGLRFSEDELELFFNLIRLVDLHSRPLTLLSTQMLAILNRTYK